MTRAQNPAYLDHRAKDVGICYKSGCILKGKLILGILTAVTDAMRETSEPGFIPGFFVLQIGCDFI